MNKKYILLTKKFLTKEYIKNKKIMRQIANEVGCKTHDVWYWMKKYKINRRTGSESKKGKCLGENNPNFKNGGETAKKHYCIDCGKEISYDCWKYGTGYCASCAKKGKRNSSYVNGKGYGQYDAKFNEELKETIRKRDNYQCQLCGITEEEHLIIYGRKNPIHHIDYNRENCKKSNLITLCSHCNSRVNFNREYWKKYFIEKVKVEVL